MVAIVGCVWAPEIAIAESPYGQLEFDVTSEYSHIRLRKRQNVRTMLFVRDSGEEVVEASEVLTVEVKQGYR